MGGHSWIQAYLSNTMITLGKLPVARSVHFQWAEHFAEENDFLTFVRECSAHIFMFARNLLIVIWNTGTRISAHRFVSNSPVIHTRLRPNDRAHHRDRGLTRRFHSSRAY